MLLFFKNKFLVLVLLSAFSLISGCPAFANDKFYSIHIKTVNTADQAEKIVADLNQKGYEGFYRHMPSFEEGIQYRVFVGAYPSKEQAINTLNKLWNSEISDRYAIAVLQNKSTSPASNQHSTAPAVKIKPIPDQHRRTGKSVPIPADPDPAVIPDKERTDITARLLGHALRYYHDNQFEKALESFNRISENIDNMDILFWTAICESKLGNYEQAAEKMKLFLAREPNTPQGMLELAAILLKQKNDAETLEELEKAKAFQPPSEMLQHIARMKRLLLEDENRFLESLDFLVKKRGHNRSAENPDPEKQDRKPPREFYQIGSKSEKLLRSAQKIDPENVAVSYYLGFIDIKNNQLANGIREWEKYLLQTPENERTIHLRKQMTLLLLRHAAVFSMRALKNGPKISHHKNDRNIAISEFQNRCFSMVPGMGKGLTALLMDDLQKIDGIRITDRILINTISRSMQPDLTPISDPYNAAKLGRQLSSNFTVWGEFTDISENAFQFTATITDSSNSNNSGMADIRGTREGFYILEKQMVFWILESVGIHKKDLPADTIFSIEKPHTRNFDAFLSYAKGLKFMDEMQFAHAGSAFQEAIQLDPTFTLAEKAFHSTPNDIYFCPFFEQSEIFAQESGRK